MPRLVRSMLTALVLATTFAVASAKADDAETAAEWLRTGGPPPASAPD